MKSNLKKYVIEAIAETQDGHLKSLRDDDHFTNFILGRIEENSCSEELPFVDIESLVSDFKYMINQLKSALRPLEKFIDEHPPAEIDPNTVYHAIDNDLLNELIN